MKNLLEHNKAVSLSIFIFFLLLAGGSFLNSDGGLFIVLVVAVIIIAIYFYIQSYIEGKQKSKRIKVIKQHADTLNYYDKTNCFGDDLCSLFYNTYKNEVNIVIPSSYGSKNMIINNFTKTHEKKQGNGYVLVDCKNKKILAVNPLNNEMNYKIVDYSHYCAINKSSNEDVCFFGDRNNLLILDYIKGVLTFLEFSNGIKYNIIKYESKNNKIDRNQLSNLFCNFYNEVNGYISIFQDNISEVLIFVSKDNTGRIFFESINYNDIISVSYEENGSSISSKSTSRMVGGAIIGGVLLGGAGAIVGGLSGKSNEYKSVKSIDVKILTRSSELSTININCYRGNLQTNKTYQTIDYNIIKNKAKQIVDIITIIIDKVDINYKMLNNNKSISSTEELIRLVDLKNKGLISDEEFIEFKKNYYLNK